MILTTKGRYAVMSIIDIASAKNGGPVSLAEISIRQNIPLSYLEQIFMKLRSSGIVTSVRGPGGGYLLSKSPCSTSIWDILYAVEEVMNSRGCTKEKKKCGPPSVKCNAHDLWAGLDRKIREYFSNISVDDVLSGEILNKDVA